MKKLAALFFSVLSSASTEACDESQGCDLKQAWGAFSDFNVTYTENPEELGTDFVFRQRFGELVLAAKSEGSDLTVFRMMGVGTLYKGFGETGIRNRSECYPIVKETDRVIQSYGARAIHLLAVGTAVEPRTLPLDSDVNYVESDVDERVQVDGGARMQIGAPWSLTGKVHNADAVTFDLKHQYTSSGTLQNLYLTGSWQDASSGPAIPNESSIHDWLICIGGTNTYKDGKPQYEPYQLELDGVQTIGELRILTSEGSEGASRRDDQTATRFAAPA